MGDRLKRGSIYGFWTVDRGSYAILDRSIGIFRVRGVFFIFFVGFGVIGVMP